MPMHISHQRQAWRNGLVRRQEAYKCVLQLSIKFLAKTVLVTSSLLPAKPCSTTGHCFNTPTHICQTRIWPHDTSHVVLGRSSKPQATRTQKTTKAGQVYERPWMVPAGHRYMCCDA